MPKVLDKKVTDSYHLMMWNVSESWEELQDTLDLSDADIEKYESIKLDLRKKEWMGRKFLFNEMHIEDLSYLKNGKPVLSEGYISISHCDDLVAVILSDSPIGIDLQNPHPKLEKIKTKFCNERELAVYETIDDPLEYVSMVWSAKEAIFKIYGENIPFADGITVKRTFEEKLDRRTASWSAELHTEEHQAHIPLMVEYFGEYHLVYGSLGSAREP